MSYTSTMKHIQAQFAPPLRKPHHYVVVLCYTALVVLVTTYSLFKFDELTDEIVRYGVGGGRGGILAAVLVVGAGVFSLPYLLRIAVSPLMRIVSALAACGVPIGWLLAAWWLELYRGGTEAFVAMMVAYLGILLAVASVWIIGVPFRPLKKHR